MITLDGSLGEGGGQILRTSLALSLVTGHAFKIDNIRAGRARPGLQRQHLTAVEAAASVGGAIVEGAILGSSELMFVPGIVRPGDYNFDVGTAGSATLVLQTVLPPLVLGNITSRITLKGGTHNPYAPPFDFLQHTFLPVLNRMGPRVSVSLERFGFFPAGGGRFSVEIIPVPKLGFLHLENRGNSLGHSARAIIAHLPPAIAHRELKVVSEQLGWSRELLHVQEVESKGPGNALLLELSFDNITETFTGVGDRGVRAEMVAENVIKEVRDYLASDAPVGEHLADQLLIPMALAGGGSFVTVNPSLHTQTNMQVISKFLPVEFQVEKQPRTWLISVKPS